MEQDIFAGFCCKCKAHVDRTKYSCVSGVVILSVYGSCLLTMTTASVCEHNLDNTVYAAWIKYVQDADRALLKCSCLGMKGSRFVRFLQLSPWLRLPELCVYWVCVHPVLQLELCHLLLLGAMPSEKWLSVSRPQMGRQHQPLTH